MYSSSMNTILLAAFPFLALPSIAIAQTTSTTPNGVIVPFSTLPGCAALCGPLFDVQGACSPPQMAVSDSCFCNSATLKPFLNSGTAGVSQVCGAASCQDAPSLQAIQSWYEGFCNVKAAQPTLTGTTTTSAPTSTSTSGSGSSSGSSSGNQSQTVYRGWWAGHWKWIVMLIVMVVAIVGCWVGASIWRKRYLRKKEREIEMRPPVTWGPNQMQGGTGGFGYGDGVITQPGPGYYNKEAVGMTPADNTRQSRGWLNKSRT
ncbi:hypothetical protein B7463_g5106, partial [Scytalidium lignicola]